MQGLVDPLLTLQPEQHVAMVAGLALLIFGKRLYWLAIGGLGALAAAWIATYLGQNLEPGIRLALAGAAGLGGAFFAVAAQKTALNVAGTLLGALLLGWASYWFQVDVRFEEPGLWPMGAAVVGAFLGLLFAQKLFNAALVVVSSAAGALLLTQGLADAWAWSPGQETLASLVSFVLGLSLQSPRKKPPPATD